MMKNGVDFIMIAQPRSQGLSSSLPRKERREILGTRLVAALLVAELLSILISFFIL